MPGTKVSELWIDLGMRLDKFNRGANEAEQAMKRVGQRMAKVGMRMTKMITLPLLGIGALSVKAFATFDKAMTESLAIMGDVSDTMRNDMAKMAKQMSTETTFAASKLAEAYFFLASAGMTAAQSIKALPVVAKFAQAGAFDLAQATDLLTDAQTAMGLSSKDAVKNQKNLIKVSDILVKANTLANASVLQFSEALTNRAAAALTNVNKGMEEGVAVLAAFADKGVKGQLAGTRLAMMLNALDMAVRSNQSAWDEHGISLFDSQGEMRSIGDLIGDLENLLGPMTTELRSATLAQLGFNVRTKASILTLLGSSEKIKQWTKDLKDAGNTTEEVAKKQLEAFSNKMKIMKNQVVNLGIEIGQSLVPTLENLVNNVIKPAVKWFAELSEKSKMTGIKIAGLAAAMGILVTVGGKIILLAPALGTAFTIMTGPIGLAAAAIAGFVLTLDRLIENQRDAIQNMKNFAKQAIAQATTADQFATLWAEARKKGGEDLKLWQELMKRYGGNVTQIMHTILTDPAFAGLNAMFKEIKESGKSLHDGLKPLGEIKIVLPENIRNMQLLQKAIEGTGLNVFDLEKKYGSFKKALIAIAGGTEKETIAALSNTEAYKRLKAAIEKVTDEQAERIRLQHLESIANEELIEDIPELIASSKEWTSTATEGFDAVLGKIGTVIGGFGNLKVGIGDLTIAQIEAIGVIIRALEASEEKWKQTFSNIASIVNQVIGGISNIMAGLFESTMMRIDNEEQARRDAIESSMMSEASKAKAIEKLDKDIEQKRRTALRKRAAAEKATALMSAIVNTARAIVEALPNLVLAGIAGALGAAQIAVIAGTPVPGGKEGGIFTKPTIIEVGEGAGRAPEVLLPLDRLTGIFRKTMEGLPKQATVSPGGRGANITLNVVNNLKVNTLDVAGTRDWMRNIGLPEIISAVKVGIQKPEFRDALGVET